MHTKRDKFLTEAMGECWHDDFRHSDGGIRCGKCKKWLGQDTTESGHWELTGLMTAANVAKLLPYFKAGAVW